MKIHRLLATLFALSVLLFPVLAAAQQYKGWQHSGALTIITTAEGAGLPAGITVEGFPLLVRLSGDWFDFKQAKAGGEDLRFSTKDGEALAYEIEEWDAAGGTASVWVRMPRIEGDAKQAIRVSWGKADAVSESNGAAVFNATNGYLSVWHLGEVRDVVGTLESKDVGTTATAGVVGKARHFAGIKSRAIRRGTRRIQRRRGSARSR